MSGAVVPSIAPADQSHRALRKAIGNAKTATLDLAVQVHEAHEAEAWKHDDGEREAEYRQVMSERRLLSIFESYCLVEFNLGRGQVSQLDNAGQLLTATTVAVDRFSERALRPLARSSVINTTATEDLAAVLDTAQTMASDERAGLARSTPAQIKNAPVTERHVRAAMKRHGVAPPARARADQSEASRTRAIARAERDLRALAADRDALRELLDLIRRMLGDG